MKKILTLFFLLVSLMIQAQKNYYIDPSGSDVTGNGSINAPWKSLYKATSIVTASGSTIHVNAGSYSEPNQMLLANGVSIEGAGRDVTTIVMTCNASYPCLKLESWAKWGNVAYGNQHITGIKFEGDLRGHTGIGVNFRSNVWIYDCEFVDFLYTAVWFAGQPKYVMTIDNPFKSVGNTDTYVLPDDDGFCTGNKFNNNIVHNCSGLISGKDYSGAVQWGTQNGWQCYDNVITCKGRSGRDNGVGIKFHGAGFNRNTKIYNNDIDVGTIATNYWQFAIEIWWSLGGLEVYNNRLRGSIDLCDNWDHYNVGFASKIHDNIIGYDELNSSIYPLNMDRGILFEGSQKSTYVYNNTIFRVARAFTGNNTQYGHTVYNGLYVYNNLCYEIGQTGSNYQVWAFQWSTTVNSALEEFKNIYIQNNVFIASDKCLDPTMYGIMIPTVDKLDGFYVENNILINWERGAVYGSGVRTKATNIYIRNNLIYGSFNSNDPVYANSFPTDGVTYSGTVKFDPLFLSAKDFHLSSTSSPAYHAGRYVGGGKDFDGNSWNNPPSIGVYEYFSSTGIRLIGHQKAIKVFPNPVFDELTIEMEGKSGRKGFKILNSLGQIIFKGNLPGKTTVSMTGFSPGVYFIKIENSNSVEVEKIVKL